MKIFKPLMIIWMVMIIAIAGSINASGAESTVMLNGFSEGSVKVIYSSATGLACGGNLIADCYLLNTGQRVNVSLREGKCESEFTGIANNHHQRAQYIFDGACAWYISSDGKVKETKSTEMSFAAEGDYMVRGYITYRWQVEKNKVNIGFPKYFYKTVAVISKTIRVSDIEDAAQPEQKKDGKEEPSKPAASLSGGVGHTGRWNEHREDYNRRCRASGRSSMIRGTDVFWSGEKFVLAAAATGEELPHNVAVNIKGTAYRTVLRGGEGDYSGELFDRSMIGRWGESGPESLDFVFSATIDGEYCTDTVTVTVDDREKYWLMHRKE